MSDAVRLGDAGSLLALWKEKKCSRLFFLFYFCLKHQIVCFSLVALNLLKWLTCRSRTVNSFLTTGHIFISMSELIISRKLYRVIESVNTEASYSLRTHDGPKQKVKKKWKPDHERYPEMSHLASIYLFFSKVLKSNSPESSFPSVLLQKNQPPAAKTSILNHHPLTFKVRNKSVVSFNCSRAVGKCLEVAKQHNTHNKSTQTNSI